VHVESGAVSHTPCFPEAYHSARTLHPFRQLRSGTSGKGCRRPHDATLLGNVLAIEPSVMSLTPSTSFLRVDLATHRNRDGYEHNLPTPHAFTLVHVSPGQYAPCTALLNCTTEMPRRPTANRQHQLIQNVSKNVSCIVTGIKDAADRVDNQVHDLVDRLGHRPMLTRRAASSLNTCLSTWGITDDEFDNFFNHGLTGQTALHKLTLLARQVTWERAKELLSESHTTQRGWKVVGSGKNGIAKNTSKWTALEIDYALTHSTPDSPSPLVLSSPAQP
jgi:hypothetical protein